MQHLRKTVCLIEKLNADVEALSYCFNCQEAERTKASNFRL